MAPRLLHDCDARWFSELCLGIGKRPGTLRLFRVFLANSNAWYCGLSPNGVTQRDSVNLLEKNSLGYPSPGRATSWKGESPVTRASVECACLEAVLHPPSK